MNLLTVIVPGIVQEFTELFPVSRFEHLVIVQSFFPGFHQPGGAFDAVLLLIITAIPVAVIGYLFKDQMHNIFESARAAAFFLIITGILLFLADKMKKTRRDIKNMTVIDGILSGSARAVPFLTGISRSGTTITSGIFCNLNRNAAARFSFLLSLPAVCGAVILKAGYLRQISYPGSYLYFAGFVCAALAGLLALKLFFLIIREARLKYFAYYGWFFGTFTLLVKSSLF